MLLSLINPNTLDSPETIAKLKQAAKEAERCVLKSATMKWNPIRTTLGMLLVLGLLSALVFRRLERIIEVATRVVGGDYDSQLFVQFRPVFVNVLAHVPELQEKH